MRSLGLGVLVGLVLVAASGGSVQAQAAPTAEAKDATYKTIASLDAQLFDAYNKCDLVKLGTMVTDDLEFYHDKTGLAVGKKVFLESIKANICGKVTRELVAGSLEAHDLHGYGAVEMGSHRFHHPGHESDPVGDAKFVMIWQQKDGVWKLSRVISYDHS